MNIEIDTVAEIIIGSISGLAIVGLTVLKFAMNGFQKQHEATQKLIEEKFNWAESRRAESSTHWEKHFSELKQSEQEASQQIRQLERRISHLEIITEQQKRNVSL